MVHTRTRHTVVARYYSRRVEGGFHVVCVDACLPTVVGTGVRRRRRRRRLGWVILVCFGATHLHHRFRAVGGRQPRARRVILEVTPGPARTLSTMMECPRACVCVCV